MMLHQLRVSSCFVQLKESQCDTVPSHATQESLKGSRLSRSQEQQPKAVCITPQAVSKGS